MADNENFIFNSENYRNCMICNETRNIKEDGFIIHTEKNIENLTSLLSIFINNNVLSFFEKNNELAYVNKKLKEQNLKPLAGLLSFFSVMQAITLMKLTKDQNFKDLSREYLDRLINPFDDFCTNKIEVTIKLIDYSEKLKIE